jgi:sugar fermentation stimulation protein A
LAAGGAVARIRGVDASRLAPVSSRPYGALVPAPRVPADPSATPLITVPHPTPLIPGRLVDRYVRFIAEVELDGGERVRAHCVNPGRMEGQVRPGARVWISPAPAGSQRKLRYTWELVEEDGQMVGANTVAPNRIVAELLAARILPGLRRFRELRSEVAYAERHRIDFLLAGPTPHYVEVKNCHLVYPDGRGYFPDSVSARASSHLAALAQVVRDGAKATVLFTIQRPDVAAIRPSDLHDPSFAAAARAAAAAGVGFRAVTIRPTLSAYEVVAEIPVDLREYDTSEHVRWRADKLPRSGWRRDPSRG